MIRPFFALFVSVIVFSNAHAENAPNVLAPLPEEESAIRSAEAVGARIFLHDRAAEVATDALMKVRGFKRNKRVQGWVTEEQADAIQVTFVGGKKGAPVAALFRVKVSASGEIEGNAQSFEEPESLSDFESAAAKAHSLATNSGFEPCSKKYNSVVLPEDQDLSHWAVYMLPATTKQNVVPLGGSYRFNVDLRSESATIRPYTKTCIQLESHPEVVALMTSHLLDPVPTEVHVFWAIWSEKPMYIITMENGSMWSVNAGKVKLERRRVDG